MARKHLLLDLQNSHSKNPSIAWSQEFLEACDGMSTVCVDSGLKPLKISVSKQVCIEY